MIGNPLRNKSALVIGGVNPYSQYSGNFVIDSASTTCTAGASVVRGGHCRIGLRFTPGVAERLSTTLMITDNASNSPQSVFVYGTGK